MTIQYHLDNAINKLLDSKSPKCDVSVLLSYVINKPISYLLCNSNYKLSIEQKKLFDKLLIRRTYHEPVAYLVNKKEFWSLSLKIIPGIFIPRPETEILVEIVSNKIGLMHYKILDLGTGCGAIALALAKLKYNCYILGVDVNSKSIQLSQYNANVLKLINVDFMQSNWFSSIKKNMRFDIIVSNPPYLNSSELNNLDQDILYEPLNALVSSKKGLNDIKYIITYSKQYLVNKGWLFIEHGWNQKNIVQRIFYQNNFSNIQSFKDYGNKYRITCGQYSID